MSTWSLCVLIKAGDDVLQAIEREAEKIAGSMPEETSHVVAAARAAAALVMRGHLSQGDHLVTLSGEAGAGVPTDPSHVVVKVETAPATQPAPAVES